MRVSPEVEIAFSLATREAARRRHEFVTVEHLLYALLFDEETAQIVRHSGGDTTALKKKLEGFLDAEITALPEGADTSPSLSLGFQRVVGRAALHVQSSGKKELKGANVLVAGTAAVLGHTMPVWLGFKGGKGGATGLGVCLAAMWPVGLACMAIWLISAKVTRISSAATLIGVASAPVLALLLSDT